MNNVKRKSFPRLMHTFHLSGNELRPLEIAIRMNCFHIIYMYIQSAFEVLKNIYFLFEISIYK